MSLAIRSTPIPFFDAHLHPEDLSDSDLEVMRHFGLRGALISSHPPGLNPTFKDTLAHFDMLAKQQVRRLESLGILAYVALGVHPARIPRRGFPVILDALPRYFRGGKVLALGEIGLENGGEDEQETFLEQVLLAKRLRLPVVIHTPHAAAREKEMIIRLILRHLKQVDIDPEKVLIDHVNTRMARTVLASGHFVGLTISKTQFKPEKAVELIQSFGTRRLVLNSDLGDGPGDLLTLPRSIHLMQKAGLSRTVIRQVSTINALTFLGLKLSQLPPPWQ